MADDSRGNAAQEHAGLSPLDQGAPRGPVGLVSDDTLLCALMAKWLREAHFEFIECVSRASVIQAPRSDVVCLDLGLGEGSALDVLAHLQAHETDATVVVITDENHPETTAAAMQRGAYDYLGKPLERERFVRAIERAIERRKMAAQIRTLSTQIAQGRAGFGVFLSLESHVIPLRELERRAIERALRIANGSVGKAAKMLGMGRATLYRRLSQLGDLRNAG